MKILKIVVINLLLFYLLKLMTIDISMLKLMTIDIPHYIILLLTFKTLELWKLKKLKKLKKLN